MLNLTGLSMYEKYRQLGIESSDFFAPTMQVCSNKAVIHHMCGKYCFHDL